MSPSSAEMNDAVRESFLSRLSEKAIEQLLRDAVPLAIPAGSVLYPEHGVSQARSRDEETAMRVHAIQTGTVAVRRRQLHGVGKGVARRVNTLTDPEWTDPLPILAWAIEHPEGVIVVDTGETARATKKGYFTRWHPYFRLGVKEWIEPEQEIGPRLVAIGIDPADVRWVVMTHLHTDHAGGLAHFPRSEIVVARQELAAATGFGGKLRGYVPHRWPEWFAPAPVALAGQPFGPFPASHALTAAGDVRLVPTFGHSAGHLSVVVQEKEQDLFIAGDASYTERLMLEQAIDGVAPDEEAARITLERILSYVRERPTVYLPSHDPDSRRRLDLRQRTSPNLGPEHAPGQIRGSA